MNPTWETAVQEAKHCGFSHAVLIPAHEYSELAHNAESIKQRILNNPADVLQSAKSVMVAVMPFSWFGPWPDDCAEVSAFYFQSQIAYMSMRALARKLEGFGACVTDSQRLPAKLVAQEAGIGRIGRNSLLHNNAWGSCITIHTLVTDIAPPQHAADVLPAPECGACKRCVDACPTGALDGTGYVDVSRCIRAHMLRGETVPMTLRDAMGMRLLGCEICQRVCPHNQHITAIPSTAASLFSLTKMLQGNPTDINIIGKILGSNEARPQRIQSQAILAAGNSLDPAYLPMLKELTQHERPSIHAHAEWAVKKIQRSGGKC